MCISVRSHTRLALQPNPVKVTIIWLLRAVGNNKFGNYGLLQMVGMGKP